ncbi:MAG: hypothetical protein KAH08_07145 [Methylococcales bacterium]|nr:hypothetical protein [Methylococcales bacterium]
MEITLQISYKHRDELLNQVIKKLKLFIEYQLSNLLFAKHILDLLIDINNLNNHAIDIIVLAQMQPIAAENYLAIKRHLNKICLQATNEYRWEIKQLHAIEQTYASLYTTKTFRNFTDPMDKGLSNEA